VRKSLSTGTILILLSGRFRGSRVVLLKVLESGLLLVTGPYGVNGVPLKRVNPAYVIATSTKVDLKEVSNDLKDEVFRRPTKEKTPKTPEQRFEKQEEQKKDKVLDPNRLNLQKTVDEQVLNAIGNNTMLKNYLKAKFTLSRGQYPHLMKQFRIRVCHNSFATSKHAAGCAPDGVRASPPTRENDNKMRIHGCHKGRKKCRSCQIEGKPRKLSQARVV